MDWATDYSVCFTEGSHDVTSAFCLKYSSWNAKSHAITFLLYYACNNSKSGIHNIPISHFTFCWLRVAAIFTFLTCVCDKNVYWGRQLFKKCTVLHLPNSDMDVLHGRNFTGTQTWISPIIVMRMCDVQCKINICLYSGMRNK